MLAPMNSEDVQRRLAAILAADVAGYSRLMGEDETGTRARFNAHLNELFEPTVTRRRGRIVKLLGDGLLVEFASVIDAVQSAIDIQTGMAERNAREADSRRMDFRVGINIGDVIVEGDDIHGDGVNVAARLEGLADPGGICMSQGAREQIRDKLACKLEDMGEVTVKNISQPIHVYRVITDDAPPARRRRRGGTRARLARPALSALVLAIAALAGWLVIPDFISEGGEQPPALISPRLSIAVLPFSNLSGNADQDYFADALTEDLTTDLSRISGSFVISRGTAATYRDRGLDTRQVARELNVRYVLEGTVRKQGDLVRVGVQLTDGGTGQQVWSERYERAAHDMYAFQNEVTGRVARTLNLELKDAESRQAARGDAGNADAADLALRAWAELWTKPQTRETNDAALAYVARALEIDADNAEASGVAAYAYARAATYDWGMSREEAIRAGMMAAERSLSVDPKNADTVYALGFLHYLAGDTVRSQEQMRQCIELNRNHAPAYFFSGLNLIRLGRPGEAIERVGHAFRLSPRDPLRSVWHGVIGRAQVLIGDDARAVETAVKGIAANPRHPHNYAVLASAHAHLGEIEQAHEALREFLDRQPGMTVSRYWRNVASEDPDAMKAYERLIVGLRKAGLPE